MTNVCYLYDDPVVTCALGEDADDWQVGQEICGGSATVHPSHSLDGDPEEESGHDPQGGPVLRPLGGQVVVDAPPLKAQQGRGDLHLRTRWRVDRHDDLVFGPPLHVHHSLQQKKNIRIAIRISNSQPW